MNKQEALAKARAAKKAKLEAINGTDNPQSPQETSSTQPADLYTPEMSDDDVIAFCEYHMKGKSADQITNTNHLEALVHYGDIMTGRRQAAEGQGREAKLKIVQMEIAKLETRFALASIIHDLGVDNLRKTITKQTPEIPFEVVFRVGEHELAVSFASVNEDHNPGQQQLNSFSKNVVEIAKIITSGCQRQYHIVNSGSGESFGLPFNFQTRKAEILAKINPNE